MIDGKRDTSTISNMWASAEEDPAPWVIMGLQRQVNIKKIVLYRSMNFPVCSYSIRDSSDDKQWNILKFVENNTSDITEDYFIGESYQYLRFDFICNR